MSFSALFNIGSLLLGLAAWGIPIAAIVRGKAKRTGTIASFTACSLSLIFQIFEIKNRTHLGDWSAIQDTIDTLSWVVVVLVVVTTVLNSIASCRTSRLKS